MHNYLHRKHIHSERYNKIPITSGMKDTLRLGEYILICDLLEMNAFHVHDEV